MLQIRSTVIQRAISICSIGMLLLLQIINVKAQSTPTLELIKRLENAITTVDSGTYFTYFIQYRCVGITDNCRDVVVTDVLPAQFAGAADDVVLSGTVHTLNQSYDPATRTATWNFIDPLPAGSTGELRLQVRFPAGVTPDATVATNQAVIDSSNAPSPVFSNSVDIESNATNQVSAEKNVRGGVVDQDTTYDIRICRPDQDTTGQLNMENITIVDQLPPDVIFVGANYGGTYDPGTNTVSWSISEFDVTSPSRCVTRQVTVRFPSGDFSAGNAVTNTVEVTGTPIGEAETTFGTAVTHDLEVPNDGGSFNKRGTTDEASIGETVRYGFEVRNTGNVALDDYLVRDVIPPQLDVTAIHTGNDAGSSNPIGICIETNLSPTCTAIPGSPFSAETTVTVSSLGLPANAYITAIEWDFAAVNPIPVGYRSTGIPAITAGFSATILPIDRDGNSVAIGDLIDNNGTLTYAYNGNPPATLIDDQIIEVIPSAAIPAIQKELDSPASVNPGETISYRLSMGNDNAAISDLINPVMADLLSEDVIFDSWVYDGRGTGIPSPIFERIDNYQGSGETLLRWRWQNSAAATFAPGQIVTIHLNVSVRPGARGGTNAIENRAYVSEWDNSVPVVECEFAVADTHDLDGDGDRDEEICFDEATAVGINSQAVMESIKEVRSNESPNWLRFPDIGDVRADNPFEYRLRLTNVGNVDISEILLIDIFPHIGDTGVIDANPRNSEFMPSLADRIIVPSGTIVEYSTEANPCRTELVASGPTNCAAPNWRTLPPTPIGNTRAIRINFGTLTLQPTESVEIIIPMLADGYTSFNVVAWNSFGYTATRMDTLSNLLPTEPFMVGVSLLPPPSGGGGSGGGDDDDDDDDTDSSLDGGADSPAAAGVGSTGIAGNAQFTQNNGRILSQEELLSQVTILPLTGESPWSRWRLPLLLGLVGAGTLGISGFILLRMRRKTAHP